MRHPNDVAAEVKQPLTDIEWFRGDVGDVAGQYLTQQRNEHAIDKPVQFVNCEF